MSRSKRLQSKLHRCRQLLSQPNLRTRDIVAAICVLLQGHFLFVEGGAIDTSHNLDSKPRLLPEANRAAAAAFAERPGSIEIYLLLIFTNIELGNINEAAEQLRKLHPYMKHYKAGNRDAYAFFVYSQTEIAKRTNNENAQTKAVRELETLAADPSQGIIMCMLAAALASQERHTEAFETLAKAYGNGYRGAFLFVLAHKLMLSEKLELTEPHPLTLGTLYWCTQNGLDIRDCDAELLLVKTCSRLIEANDYSQNAMEYYLLAENKQLHIAGLSEAIVHSSFINNLPSVSRYSLKQFLSEHTLSLDKPEYTALAAYIYHNLVTNKKMRNLAQKYHDNILEFACYAYDNNLEGRYVNSSYAYFIKYCIEFERNNSINFTDASTYTNSAVAELAEYALGIMPVLWAHILTTDIKPDFELLRYFYDKGFVSDELIIALAKHFIELESSLGKSARVERKHEEKLSFGRKILRQTLKLTDLSPNFVSQAATALAGLCAITGDHAGALYHYAQTDISRINARHVDKMLSTFIETAQWVHAANLIAAKSQCLDERTLFKALTLILTHADKTQDAELRQATIPLANAAYGLTVKSWFDKPFLELVLEYYNGTQDDWQALADALHLLNADDNRLYEKILADSLFTNNMNAGSQRVFAKIYAKNPEHSTVTPYLTAIIYQIMVNNIVPEPAIIEILEHRYLTHNDTLLGCGLSYVYLNSGVITLYSDHIIKRTFNTMQARGVLLPPFKRVKDKSAFSSYLVKNTPFAYRTLPGKEVYLMYRFSADSEFERVKMNYLFFGIYTCHIAQFSGETLEFYFSETSKSGSVDTKPETVVGGERTLHEGANDPYFMLNNALIYEQMFRYDKVEEIISDYLRDDCVIKSELL